ncbi:hypothetical protein ABTK71_19470, partial [Acinetobacter baumannii]
GTGKTKNRLPVGNIFYRKSNISALHNSISLLHKYQFKMHLHFCNSKITLMSKRGIFLSLMILVLNVADAQTKKESNDTLHIRSLPDVTVVG